MINDSNKLKSFIKQLSSISQQYGKSAVIENINNAIDKIDNSTSILFCGEFKRGKSSLINAIIGDEICPTDIGIATAVVTRIMYGQTKKAVRSRPTSHLSGKCPATAAACADPTGLKTAVLRFHK